MKTSKHLSQARCSIFPHAGIMKISPKTPRILYGEESVWHLLLNGTLGIVVHQWTFPSLNIAHQRSSHSFALLHLSFASFTLPCFCLYVFLSRPTLSPAPKDELLWNKPYISPLPLPWLNHFQNTLCISQGYPLKLHRCRQG